MNVPRDVNTRLHGVLHPENMLLPPDDTTPINVTGRVESTNFLGGAILYPANLGYGRSMLPEIANQHNRLPGRGG